MLLVSIVCRLQVCVVATTPQQFSITVKKAPGFQSSRLVLGLHIQASLVIRGRYVPVFWTANTEFADKKTHFD